MAEIYPIEDVLRKLELFSPVQRILLATPGTLQSTLSAFFASPVKVRVTSQEHVPDTANWTRSVDLYIEKDGDQQVVCVAESEVVIEPKEAQELIEAEQLGIGQIMEYLGIRPKFTLTHTNYDAIAFWRLYILKGGGITYEIREYFPAQLYK